MMYNVYYEDDYERRHQIAAEPSEKDAYNAIYDYLHDHRYFAPYIRTWVAPNGEIWCDIGSHSEFFVIVKGV